jgi:hypothetical protein
MSNKPKILIYTLLVCSLSLLFFSCNNPARPGSTTTSAVKNTNMDTAINLQKAEAILYVANTIVGPAVGAAGVRTDLYKSYKWLITNADNASLVKLAGEKNPYTRTYTFMALCRRKDALVKSFLRESIHDTTSLYMMDGCLGSSCALNAIWLSKSQGLLSKSEYNSFLKKVSKGNKTGYTTLCMIPSED